MPGVRGEQAGVGKQGGIRAEQGESLCMGTGGAWRRGGGRRRRHTPMGTAAARVHAWLPECIQHHVQGSVGKPDVQVVGHRSSSSRAAAARGRRRRGVRGPARRSHVSACPTTAALALPLHAQVPATHMHVLARAGVMGCLQGEAAWQDRSPNCCPPPPAGRDPCPSPPSAPADAVLVPHRSRSTQTLATSGSGRPDMQAAARAGISEALPARW